MACLGQENENCQAGNYAHLEEPGPQSLVRKDEKGTPLYNSVTNDKLPRHFYFLKFCCPFG